MRSSPVAGVGRNKTVKGDKCARWYPVRKLAKAASSNMPSNVEGGLWRAIGGGGCQGTETRWIYWVRIEEWVSPCTVRGQVTDLTT